MVSVFHFTHGANLDAILRARELRCSATARCVQDIASAEIKANRATKRVPCAPHGLVGDYVPFYFAPRSPMLYRLRYEGIDQRALVYSCSRVEALVAMRLAVVVTDGNAASALTRFGPVAELHDLVDFPLMRERYWNDTPEDGDRKRRRQAELLVHERVPIQCIHELGVFDEAVASRVRGIVAAAGLVLPVSVRRDWYF